MSAAGRAGRASRRSQGVVVTRKRQALPSLPFPTSGEWLEWVRDQAVGVDMPPESRLVFRGERVGRQPRDRPPVGCSHWCDGCRSCRVERPRPAAARQADDGARDQGRHREPAPPSRPETEPGEHRDQKTAPLASGTLPVAGGCSRRGRQGDPPTQGVGLKTRREPPLGGSRNLAPEEAKRI